MKENLKQTKYPSKNLKSETYNEGETFVTKDYYDAKNAFVRELSYLTDGVKEVKHFTTSGVLAKVDYFVNNLRHGVEKKYIISQAKRTVKSSKMYVEGKLHGDNITYNAQEQIIKHELFAQGKRVAKYLYENNEITAAEVLDSENIQNLNAQDYEKLQGYLT